MSAHGARLSFKQYLLIAFFLMASLFAASSFIGIKTLDYLGKRSQETATSAVKLNELAQDLSSVGMAMERSARQYMVLMDAPLLQSYEESRSRTNQIIAELRKQNVVTDELVEQWRDQTQQLSEILTSIKNQPENIAELQHQLIDQFQDLEATQTLINTAVQMISDLRNQQLQDDIARRQHWMTQLMIGLVAVALLMALAFGVWLARPFRRIEKAIVRLGENQFDTVIDIHGPADVRKLGRQLDWLRMRLAEIDADKARFLRHTSHELKTPLAALREGISLLQEGLAGTLSSNQKDVVHILQQNAVILQKQIEDLLRFNAAAFEARKLARKPTNLLELAEDQVDAQQLQWQANDLHLRVDGEPVVAEVDPEKIATVLSNLLSNAIRFSPPEGHINIQVSSQGEKAYIDIIDEGPGITPQDQQHIFEPFYRGKVQPQNVSRGTGIGLSIVQEYIHAHGGRIELIPHEHGTHFRIELPYANVI